MSMAALSVSITASTSPLRTWSPSCLTHWLRTPSSMVSDSRGMNTSGISAPEDLADDPGDHPGVRQGGKLERFGVRQRHLGGGDPPDRGVEVVERALLYRRGDLRADAVAEPVVL